YGPGGWTTVLVLGGTSWMTAARLVRGEMLRQSAAPFVQAARAAGLPRWRIGILHLFPAALTALGVEATLRVGETILLEATLSFLELGVQEPTPSWGNLIRSGQASLPHAWWIALFPGLLIALTVICCASLSERRRSIG
ncbi:MAG: ABC transporter permease, partial [Acidobacteriota bacterium]|nr:ABC transporter permease [Acidobacteriota bacterium]